MLCITGHYSNTLTRTALSGAHERATAYQLAKHTGWAQNTIRNWLKGGAFPDEEKCLTIAGHLGAHPSVILCAVAADRAHARGMPTELVDAWKEGAAVIADQLNPQWRNWREERAATDSDQSA